jgi:hypothetical protein
VQSAAEVPKDVASVWAAMLQIGRWWDPAHTYSKDPSNLTLQNSVGGCLCEKVGEGAVEHMRVIQVLPGKLMRLSGGLGPLQQFGVAGSLTWTLESTAKQSTRVTWIYVVGGYSDPPLSELAAPVDAVLSQQLQRLVRYSATGSPGEIHVK